MNETIDMAVVEELLELCDAGDTSLISELIGMFLDDSPLRVQAIVQGASAADLLAVEQAAHSLKAAAGNLGANLLMNVAENLQNSSRHGELDRVRELVPELQQQHVAAANALRELRASYA